jgi:hypothetical protein
MNAWAQDHIRRIANADDLHVSPFREDGVTYGTPTWIWSVVVKNVLYVRPYNGSASRWYKAQVTQSGMIVRPTSESPVEEAFGLLDGQIIYGSVTMMHQPIFSELPIFISVGAMPLAGHIMRLICKADGYSGAVESPQFLDEAIVEFL